MCRNGKESESLGAKVLTISRPEDDLVSLSRWRKQTGKKLANLMVAGGQSSGFQIVLEHTTRRMIPF